MNTRDALALMAGLGTGYMQQQDKDRALKLQQDNVDWQNNLRKRDQDAYDLAQKQRADLIAAAAPQTPTAIMQKPDTADNIDVGQDTSAAPAPTGQYDVNGTPYADQAAATAAATAANTPTAQMARMAQAYRVNGDPVAAAQLEQQARQSQLGQLQLDAAQRADLQARTWADANAKIQSPEDVAKFISDSKGDGHGGALKATTVRNKDGSFTVNRQLDDGSTTPLGTFTSVEDAKARLVGAMTPEMMLTHAHQSAMEKIAQQTADQTGTYQQGMLKNNAERIQLMGEAAQARAEAAAERAKAAAQNAKDPVLQARLGIAGKMLEQTTEQISKLRAADGYDPTKPPKGEATLLASQAALQQQILDLTSGKAHPGGVPAIFNQPAAAPLPAGAHHIPGFVAPPVVPATPAAAPVAAVAPGPSMALMSTNPALRASGQAQRDAEARSAAAGMRFQRLMQDAQAGAQ